MVSPRPVPGADFAAHACELLAPLGRCTARRMFGGFGIACEGFTVALVADLGQGLQLWLKADETSGARFAAAGCARFTYTAAGMSRRMNYYTAPDEAMESPDAMRPWAQLAWQAAVSARATANRPPARAKRRTPAKTEPAAR